MNTELTKEAAITRLENAGYNAEAVTGGVVVKGEGWEAFFADSGQDGNTYTGNVPSEVDDLAVWDDASTRANHYADGSGVPTLVNGDVTIAAPLTTEERNRRLADLGDMRKIRTISDDGRDISL